MRKNKSNADLTQNNNNNNYHSSTIINDTEKYKKFFEKIYFSVNVYFGCILKNIQISAQFHGKKTSTHTIFSQDDNINQFVIFDGMIYPFLINPELDIAKMYDKVNELPLEEAINKAIDDGIKEGLRTGWLEIQTLRKRREMEKKALAEEESKQKNLEQRKKAEEKKQKEQEQRQITLNEIYLKMDQTIDEMIEAELEATHQISVELFQLSHELIKNKFREAIAIGLDNGIMKNKLQVEVNEEKEILITYIAKEINKLINLSSVEQILREIVKNVEIVSDIEKESEIIKKGIRKLINKEIERSVIAIVSLMKSDNEEFQLKCIIKDKTHLNNERVEQPKPKDNTYLNDNAITQLNFIINTTRYQAHIEKEEFLSKAYKTLENSKKQIYDKEHGILEDKSNLTVLKSDEYKKEKYKYEYFTLDESIDKMIELCEKQNIIVDEEQKQKAKKNDKKKAKKNVNEKTKITPEQKAKFLRGKIDDLNLIKGVYDDKIKTYRLACEILEYKADLEAISSSLYVELAELVAHLMNIFEQFKEYSEQCNLEKIGIIYEDANSKLTVAHPIWNALDKLKIEIFNQITMLTSKDYIEFVEKARSQDSKKENDNSTDTTSLSSSNSGNTNNSSSSINTDINNNNNNTSVPPSPRPIRSDLSSKKMKKDKKGKKDKKEKKGKKGEQQKANNSPARRGSGLDQIMEQNWKIPPKPEVEGGQNQPSTSEITEEIQNLSSPNSKVSEESHNTQDSSSSYNSTKRDDTDNNNSKNSSPPGSPFKSEENSYATAQNTSIEENPDDKKPIQEAYSINNNNNLNLTNTNKLINDAIKLCSIEHKQSRFKHLFFNVDNNIMELNKLSSKLEELKKETDLNKKFFATCDIINQAQKEFFSSTSPKINKIGSKLKDLIIESMGLKSECEVHDKLIAELTKKLTSASQSNRKEIMGQITELKNSHPIDAKLLKISKNDRWPEKTAETSSSKSDTEDFNSSP